MTSERATDSPAVHVVTLGCARNEVDSEELAARLVADGYRLAAEPAEADAVLVNTCGFVEAAKKDSIDTLLSAADLKGRDGTQAVVAVGCLAERYGSELADALPEADAVLGFDAYADIGRHVRRVLGGERPDAHVPRDRRRLLPLAPVERQRGLATVAIPGHSLTTASASRAGATRGGSPAAPTTAPWLSHRRRLTHGPSAPLKIASGCDRRCTFCAIPRFRGSYVSRPPDDILAEGRWLVGSGVRELFLVSENSSSYGKDLGNIRLLESLLGGLATVEELNWIRVSYLQPAEMRPSLIDVMTGTPGVVPYFDLSFQHASESVLRRMRRFGSPDRFLTLLDVIRQRAPQAGIRSNVICGFPGETDADIEVLEQFLAAARLDAIGVFGYSDEDGTEAAGLDGQLPPREIAERRDHLSDVVDSLVTERAESRIGEAIEVLIEETGREVIGRAQHQGPDSDGSVRLIDDGAIGSDGLRLETLRVGDVVAAQAVAAEGADLVARIVAEP